MHTDKEDFEDPFDSMDKTVAMAIKFQIWAWIVSLAFTIGCAAVLLYIAGHFVAKYW